MGLLGSISSSSGISPAVTQTAGAVARQTNTQNTDKTTGTSGQSGQDKQTKQTSDRDSVSLGTNNLTPEEQKVIKELSRRDQQVRTHEQAHIAAGGNLVRGGPSYQYEIGPDGKNYAVGGEVQIDTSPIKNDPQATIYKAQHIRQAALAPADPSAQDRSVASQAVQMQIEAQQELTQKNAQSTDKTGSESQGGQTQKEENTSTSTAAHKAYQTSSFQSQSSMGTPVLEVFSA